MDRKEEENRRKFQLAVEWLWKCKRGKSLKTFFEENHYERVIVYGMGLLGELLLDEISEYVTICFDRKGSNPRYENVVNPDDIEESGICINDSDLAVITLMDLDRKIESKFYHLGFQGDVLNLYDIVQFLS